MPLKKAKQILCLSGWGQKFDSLEVIFKESNFDPFFVSSFDYSATKSGEDFFDAISSQNLNPEILIGWSLGGQLAIRLIEKKNPHAKITNSFGPAISNGKRFSNSVWNGRKNLRRILQEFLQFPNQNIKAIFHSNRDE